MSSGLRTRDGFVDFGNFEATGIVVSLAAGANAVLIRERLELGAVDTTAIASQGDFSVNGLLVKMTMRYRPGRRNRPGIPPAGGDRPPVRTPSYAPCPARRPTSVSGPTAAPAPAITSTGPVRVSGDRGTALSFGVIASPDDRAYLPPRIVRTKLRHARHDRRGPIPGE